MLLGEVAHVFALLSIHGVESSEHSVQLLGGVGGGQHTSLA
jgi:hypothetical protein